MLIYCENCGNIALKRKVIHYNHDNGMIDPNLSYCPCCAVDFSISGSFEDLDSDDMGGDLELD